MNRKQKKPTENEMAILQILWDRGPSTVREVHEILSASKEVGYTTTLKLMQIMIDKELLLRNDESKTHVYSPALKKVAVQKQAVGGMIKGLFKGSSANLVMHALGNYRTSPEELREIKKYINEMEKKKNG